VTSGTTSRMPELGRLGVWGHLDSLSFSELADYAARVEELGFGTLWVPETVGREPFTLLGLLAGETSSLLLGTSIVSIWGHDAQTTRMAALTLQEASGGRFVLGLGVSHPHLAERLRGHTYDRPLTRMREFLAAYRAAVYKGPMGDGSAEPPVLLAALRERMLALSATAADGAFPYLVTPDRVVRTRSVLDAAAPDRHPLLAVSLPAVLETDAVAARAATWRPTSGRRRTRRCGRSRASTPATGRSRAATGWSMPWWPGVTQPPSTGALRSTWRPAPTTWPSSRSAATAPPRTWPCWRPWPADFPGQFTNG
jgi:probable F420-dependent oxidoreductase